VTIPVLESFDLAFIGILDVLLFILNIGFEVGDTEFKLFDLIFFIFLVGARYKSQLVKTVEVSYGEIASLEILGHHVSNCVLVSITELLNLAYVN
jgi:hypothetical protein